MSKTPTTCDRPLIINADDFGKDEETNAAVVACFEKGLCSSATVMVNTAGFAHACQLIHEKELLDCVGLHLVLTTGYPITREIQKYSRFCDDFGRFNTARTRIFRLSDSERKVLAAEIRAQITRCRNFGLPLTHIDSHHHRHEEWGIRSVLVQVMKEYGIQYLRPMANVVPARTLVRRVYVILYNRILKSLRLSRTDFFGSIHAYLKSNRMRASNNHLESSEVCIHPVFAADRTLKDAQTDEPVENLVRKIGNYQNAVSFFGSSCSR